MSDIEKMMRQLEENARSESSENEALEPESDIIPLKKKTKAKLPKKESNEDIKPIGIKEKIKEGGSTRYILDKVDEMMQNYATRLESTLKTQNEILLDKLNIVSEENASEIIADLTNRVKISKTGDKNQLIETLRETLIKNKEKIPIEIFRSLDFIIQIVSKNADPTTGKKKKEDVATKK